MPHNLFSERLNPKWNSMIAYDTLERSCWVKGWSKDRRRMAKTMKILVFFSSKSWHKSSILMASEIIKSSCVEEGWSEDDGRIVLIMKTLVLMLFSKPPPEKWVNLSSDYPSYVEIRGGDFNNLSNLQRPRLWTDTAAPKSLSMVSTKKPWFKT